MEIIEPEYHRSYKKLRTTIERAWESISEERIKGIVSGKEMRARCQAVIDADGYHTKY